MARLIILVILLLLSLLCVFRAFTYHLWLMAILVSEYSIYFVLLTITVLIWGFWIPKHSASGTIIGIAALLLFAKPLWEARIIARQIKQDFQIPAIGTKHPDTVRFNLMQTLLVNSPKQIAPNRLVYASPGGQDLALDFYPSSKKGRKPCVVVVHGGSWKSGDNKQLPELNSYLADKGYHVAAINYRLAPKYQSPLQVSDLKLALEYLLKKSGTLEIDSSQLVLLGRSAGAQIALLAAYILNQGEIKGVIDFYGPADMVWGYSVPSNPLVMNSRKVMEDYLGGTYSELPNKYLESSPIHFISKGSVPTLIIHGNNDVLVAYEHSIRLKKKLDENGVKNYFLSLPWATHGFDYNINGPGGQLSTFAVMHFLSQVTD